MTENAEETVLSLSQIIKSFIKSYPEFDPFTDGFGRTTFSIRLLEFITVKNVGHYKIKDNGEAIAILDLNEIYEAIMVEIESLLDEINLDRINVIHQFLLLSNYDAAFLNQAAINRALKDDKNVPIEFGEIMNGEIETVFNEKVKIHDAADTNIEICNVLINIIAQYDPKRDPGKPTLSGKDMQALMRKCMLYANLLFNLKDAFEYFKREFGEIERKENSIKFKHHPQYYYSLRRAGTERFSNHLHEYSIYLDDKFSNSHTLSPTPIISTGRLTFKLSDEKKKNMYRQVSTGLEIAYFFHLQSVNIKELDNIPIHIILLVISDLQFLFSTLNNEEFLDRKDQIEITPSIPVLINKKELTHHLHKLSGIKETTVVKILASMFAVMDGNIDLWKSPLLSYGSDYYFNTNAISKLNTAYLADQLINKYIPKGKHLGLFSRYLVGDMMLGKLDKGIKRLSDTEHPTLSKMLSESLIFELETVYVLLEACIVPFPFNSKEYEQMLDEITEATFRLQEKKEVLQQYLGDKAVKEIICVAVPNYPSLSGLVMNDCFVLDPFLLSNYFSTGAFKRAMVVIGQKKMEAREMATNTYYSTEQEMSENFLPFCMSPTPIKHLLSTYKFQEYPLGLPDSSPTILQDSIYKIPLEDMIWANVAELEYYMLQLFYFEKPLEKKETAKKVIEERIYFLLPSVMSAIAFLRENREARSRLLQIFKTVGPYGLTYLIQSLIDSLRKLEGRTFRKMAPFQHASYEGETTAKDLSDLLQSTLNKDSQVSLSTLKLQHSLSEEKEAGILEYLLGRLSLLEQRQYSSEELEEYYMWIIFFSALAREQTAYKRFLYDIYLNFIDALNFNFQYQTARNFAEEVLLYSFEVENLPFLGWLCLFRCYEKQKNVFDAAFYGTLFTACVEISPDTDEELLTSALYNAMLFFRDCHMPEMENAIYDILKQFDLSEYDTQKITLSHFSSNLFRKPFENQAEEFKQIKEYLEKNIECICKYREKGAMPWLVLLYNIQHLLLLNGNAFDSEFIDKTISRLEKELDEEQLSRLQAQFSPVQEVSKELFKEALAKIFQSIQFEDMVFELENLEPLARNVALLSIDPADISSLLLTGLVINDQSLTFPKKETQQTAPFINETDLHLTEKLNDYCGYVLPKLQLQEGQVVIWLFDLFNKVYCMKINWHSECEVISLSSWSMVKMGKWLDSIAGFSFNDKGGEYFINEQERDYTDLASKLAFAHLQLADDIKEVFLYKSLGLSAFPDNLINIPVSDDSCHNNHQLLVKEQIRTKKTDFISLYKPVTNVISIEWFIENHAPVTLSANDFTISCWIPTDDDDYALHLGLTKLVPLLEEQYGTKIITDLVPPSPLHANINVFMAHGGKGVEGFRAIYTGNEEGHAIIKENGIDRIVGSGVIAVLFICHAAYVSPEIFSQRLISLCHHVLSLGYKAVIAPAWSLNPIITPVWLEKFLDCLTKGQRVSECVLNANVKVMESGFNEYHGFYAPSGWAAMHLYGNPNIYFQSDDAV